MNLAGAYSFFLISIYILILLLFSVYIYLFFTLLGPKEIIIYSDEGTASPRGDSVMNVLYVYG